MGTEHAPVCLRHTEDVRMSLLTLHSDQSAPEQVLAVYICPDCGSERRLPIEPDAEADGPVASTGAA